MTIVLTPVTNYVRRGRPSRGALVLSDRLPPAGSAELLTFATTIGLKPAWVRGLGAPHEHFAVYGRRVDAAIEAGAVRIDRFRMAELYQEKGVALDHAVLLHRCGIVDSQRGFD